MVNVGIIGVGFMGVTHYKALQKVGRARVAAISTRDAKKLAGDWREIKGNFGDDGGVQDLSGIARYENWRDLIADETIDLVDICLPTELHREVSIAALQAGKHVLVEKPLALSLEDADAMIEVAQTADRMLLVGHVIRFFPAFAHARELVRSGGYGGLIGAHFKRIIGAPTPEKKREGGAALDLHIHDIDFIHALCGVPAKVRATGVHSNGAMNYLQTQYFYEGNKPCVSCQSGAISAPGLSFEHGFDIYLENATIQYNNLFTGDDIWLYSNGEKQIVHPPGLEPFEAQLGHVINCVATNQVSPDIAAPLARQALAVCFRELESVATGETVVV